MKITRAQITVALVCAILGLMLAYQFKNAKYLSAIANTMQIERLQQQLDDAQKQKEDLEKNINDLDKKIDEYEKAATTGDSLAQSLKEELDNIKMFAGLKDVNGPGIVLTTKPVKADFTNTAEVYQDLDDRALQMCVNELMSSGAEAISINGQRIVGSTGIKMVGNNISINDVKYSPDGQFEIKAIGNKNFLNNGIHIKDGLMDWLYTIYGIKPDISIQDKVLILKSQKVVKIKYMQPEQEDKK